MATDPTWWSSHFLWQEPGHKPWSWNHPDDQLEHLRFPLLDAELHLSITSDTSDLSLAVPGSDPMQLGWDDEAHFFPNIFRWVEMSAILDHITHRDPWQTRPELAVALLYRYVVATTDHDVNQMRDRVLPALETLGLDETRRQEVISSPDWRPGRTGLGDEHVVGPGWVPDERVGWRLDLWWTKGDVQAPGDWRAGHSLRMPDNPDFPASQLNEILSRLGVR